MSLNSLEIFFSIPKILKKIVKTYLTLDNVIFILVLGAIITYLFFQVIILKTSSSQVAVTTTSMVPTYQGFDLRRDPDNHPMQYYDIFRGDLLIIQNFEPHVGDVAIFNASIADTNNPVNCEQSSQLDVCATPIVHRLIAERTVNGTIEFATKGDHNPTSDAGYSNGNAFGWIKRSTIFGIVVFAIHYVDWFSLLIQSSVIRIFLILAVLAIIGLMLFGSKVSSKKTTEEKSKSNPLSKNPKKKVNLILKKIKVQINRTGLFVLLFIIINSTVYAGIGLANYTSGQNTLQPSLRDNSTIDLRSDQVENYSNNYFVNYLMNISSSGFLNTVNRIEITPVYNNLSILVTNPSYIWTIVYDFSGTKLVHPVLIFNVPQNVSNVTINTTITF